MCTLDNTIGNKNEIGIARFSLILSLRNTERMKCDDSSWKSEYL
jgi:hypothetical protein